MRFLFLHPFLSSKGGAQLALFWVVTGLARRGHSVKVVTASDPDNLSAVLARSNIAVKVADIKPGFRPEFLHPWTELLREEAKTSDLIVAGNFPAPLWAGFAKGNYKNLPAILWYANEPPRFLYEKTMSSHFLRSSLDPKFYFPWTTALQQRRNRKLAALDLESIWKLTEIAAISKQTAHWIRQIYQREAPIIHLGVGDMSPQTPRFSDGPFVFLAPAGLEPMKNFRTALEALKIAAAESPPDVDLRIEFTGGGPWRQEAEKLAARLGISARVTFAGQVSRDKLKEMYAACHAVLFIPVDEPFGLVSCEAGLYGKPVVASNHGGPAEVVLPQVTGFLVDPLDPRAVAEAMLALARNAPLCREMGNAAVERIGGKFNMDGCLEKLEQAAARISLSA